MCVYIYIYIYMLILASYRLLTIVVFVCLTWFVFLWFTGSHGFYLLDSHGFPLVFTGFQWFSLVSTGFHGFSPVFLFGKVCFCSSVPASLGVCGGWLSFSVSGVLGVLVDGLGNRGCGGRIA